MAAFSGIIKNEALINALSNAVAQNKVSNAYIIEGAGGSGKSLISGAFARALNCENFNGSNNAGETDCRCASCQTFNAGSNPDIFFVSAVKTKSISVDNIREQLVNEMFTRPFSFRYKVFIIGEADTMTTEAQNALLKTLEEPPAYGVIILNVENINKLLPTIRSRAVKLKTQILNADDIVSYLVKTGVSENDARVAANFSQGCLGQAVTLATDKQFLELRENVIGALCNFKDDGTVFGAYETAKLFDNKENKEYINKALDIALLFYRDLLIFKQSPRQVFQTDKLPLYEAYAGKFGINELAERIQTIDDTIGLLSRNVNTSLALEGLFLGGTTA